MQWKEGVDYYLDRSGRMVMTARYHLQRGSCCGSGCRHCPFDYAQVPEPRKTVLRRQAAAALPENKIKLK
jgi:hypothetical protein